MTPEQLRQFNEMQANIKKIMDVLDVTFIENGKKRIAQPVVDRTLTVKKVVKKSVVGDTTGTTRSVNEGGSSTYNVAKIYDGTITIEDESGNLYKLGYYNA